MTAEQDHKELIRRSTSDPIQRSARQMAIEILPGEFRRLGDTAFAHGHIIGDDRKTGESPFGHGSDAVVAVARLITIAATLLEGCASLLSQGNNYATSALSRQLVEIEYLLWTFNHEPLSAEKWLRSDKSERMKFFTPSAMRKRSEGWFKQSDYANHCELGGHPVPNSEILLQENDSTTQIVMADCLMHARQIYVFGTNFLGFSRKDPDTDIDPVMSAFDEWWEVEEIKQLPPTPEI